MALITTLGGSTSDSYIDVAGADTYFTGHYMTALNTAWTALSTPQKERALKRACQIIEQLRVLDTLLGSGSLPLQLVEIHYSDLTIHRLESGQALNFPRNIDVDINANPVLVQEVPDAQCEQAVYLLSFDESALITSLSGISEESFGSGPVRTHQKFKNGGTALAPMAWELMRQFIRPTTRVQRA